MPEDQKPEFEEEARSTELSPEVKEVYDKLRKFASDPARRKWIKRRAEAWKGAIENDILDEKEKNEFKDQDLDPVIINKCNKGVQASCAMATYKKPEAVFLPIGKGDLYVAEIFKRGFDYNWAVNQGNLISYDVVEESKLGGIGFFDAYWDQNKGIMGRIVLDEDDPTCLYWDSKSRKRDFSDTDIIKARLRSKKYLKASYEGLKDADLDMKFSLDDATETEGVTKGDNYKEFEDQEQTRPGKKGDNSEQENIWEIQALLLVTSREDWAVYFDEKGNPTSEPLDPEIWEKTGEKDGKGHEIIQSNDGMQEGRLWKRTYEKRVHRLIVGRKLISEEDNPYGLDSDRDPVVNIVPVRHQRTLTGYPMSPTNYALPINKEKIKRRAQFVLNATHNVNSPIVQPEGTRWRDRKGKDASPGTPGTIGTIPKTATQFPQRLSPGAMQAELFGSLEDRADRDIDQQYDAPPMIKGEVPQGMDPSGRAVLALQDMAGVMGTPFLTTFESGIINIAKVITYLSLQNWTRREWERLVENDELQDQTVVAPDSAPGEKPEGKVNPMTGMPEEPEVPEGGITVSQKWIDALDLIKPEDPEAEPGITLLDLNVKVLAGSSMPTNRIARQQVALEMKNQGVYDAEAVLDYTDDPAKDKIIPRIKAMEKAAAEAAAMKGMNKG